MTVETTSQELAVETPEVIAEPTAQPQSTTPPESEAQAPAKPEANPVQKRIDQLTRRQREAERIANQAVMAQQAAEQRAAAIEQQWQQMQRQAQQPRFEQYGDPDRYAQAVQQWSQQDIAEANRRAQEAVQQSRQQLEAQQFSMQINARVAEGKQQYKDFEEVINNPDLPPLPVVNPAVIRAVLDHDQFPALMYHLGKNPDVAHEIARLPPHRAILEVGKLAERLAKPVRQTTQATAPPPQVGSSPAPVTKDPNDMSYDEFVAWRKRSIAAKRR